MAIDDSTLSVRCGYFPSQHLQVVTVKGLTLFYAFRNDLMLSSPMSIEHKLNFASRFGNMNERGVNSKGSKRTKYMSKREKSGKATT